MSERVGNGLSAPSYVALADIDVTLGGHVLIALRRARIAAYLSRLPEEEADEQRRRLFVATTERADARAIVTVTVRTGDLPPPPVEAFGERDVDAEFAALIADWDVDTTAALRSAERDLTREDPQWRQRLTEAEDDAEDAVWLDDDHYVPPPPPPLPRLTRATVRAVLVLAGAILVLAFGDWLGFTEQLTLVLGISGILCAAWLLYRRLREDPRDTDDDGAIL